MGALTLDRLWYLMAGTVASRLADLLTKLLRHRFAVAAYRNVCKEHDLRLCRQRLRLARLRALASSIRLQSVTAPKALVGGPGGAWHVFRNCHPGRTPQWKSRRSTLSPARGGVSECGLISCQRRSLIRSRRWRSRAPVPHIQFLSNRGSGVWSQNTP